MSRNENQRDIFRGHGRLFPLLHLQAGSPSNKCRRSMRRLVGNQDVFADITHNQSKRRAELFLGSGRQLSRSLRHEICEAW